MSDAPEVRDIKFPKKQKKSRTPEAPPAPPPAKSVISMPRKGTLIASLLILAVLAAGGAYFVSRKFAAPRPARVSTPLIGEPLNNILDMFRNGTDAAGGVRDVSVGAVALLNLASDAVSRLPAFISGQNSGLVEVLSNMDTDLQSLIQGLDKVASSDAGSRGNVPLFGNYLAWRGDLARGETLLQGALTILKDPGEHHFLLILGNTSELRPAGGFLGSFADVTVSSGTVKNIILRDINEVDNTRVSKVVPPRPLQAVTARWRTADANWFFDYPQSAKKIMQFMHESTLYATTTIDGTVAITPQVIKDILNVAGPVALADGTEITGGNFLTEIQQEVQSGQASRAAHPKAILAEIMPVLQARLAALSSNQTDELLRDAKDWVKNRDVMIYMHDPKMAEVLSSYGADGGIYILPDKFKGDYLAVVDANVGGGKTDLYTAQKVSLTSRIDESGVVHDQLTVVRAHSGDRAAEWWYKVPNWDYLQIFTPSGSLAEGAAGLGRRAITPKANYKTGYDTDPDVQAVENTALASGDGELQVFAAHNRNIFATWQKLMPGESKTIQLNYKYPLTSALADGSEYTFVYEAQAGASSTLDLLLSAPVGFVWKENNLPVYEYKSDRPPGRMVVSLTLMRAK